MTKIQTSISIIDQYLSPFLIKFDGKTFFVYKVVERKSKDGSHYVDEKFIQPFSGLEGAAEYIIGQRVLEKGKQKKNSKLNNVTLAEFIVMYKEIRNEVLEGLKLK